MKKVFYGFLILIGLGTFYYTPLSFYLEPSYWKFRKMCKMQYDFMFKSIGSEEDIVAYANNYKIRGSWDSGRYYPTIHALLYGLEWDEFYINCTDFYNEWDKDWYNKAQRRKIYEK